MKKKVFYAAAFLAAIMLIGVFTGCSTGTGDINDEPRSITLHNFDLNLGLGSVFISGSGEATVEWVSSDPADPVYQETFTLNPLPDLSEEMDTAADLLAILPGYLQDLFSDAHAYECDPENVNEVVNRSKKYTVTVTGNVTGFICNGFGVTEIEFDNMTTLNVLMILSNKLTDIDVKGLTNLWMLFVGNAALTSSQKLETLDASGLPFLQLLGCGGMDTMTSLNVAGCPLLLAVNCMNDGLEKAELEAVFTALPTRTPSAPGIILCGGDNPNPGYEDVVTAGTTSIATAKNWYVYDMPAP